MKTINIAFTAKPKYKFCISYVRTAIIVRTENCLRGKRAVLNLFRLLMNSRERAKRLNRNHHSTLHTAKKGTTSARQINPSTSPPRHFLNTVSVLHKISPWAFCLVSGSFIASFQKFLPTELKVVSWHSQPVTMLALMKTLKDNCTSNNVSYNRDRADKQNANHDAFYSLVRVEQLIVR